MANKRIFLVEDDVNFGSVLKSFLEMNDLDVDWVDDGQNAISTFKSNTYNLCILDVMLPHVDGFTIGAEIKRLSQETPIIYLTAKNMKEDMINGYKIGADDYITKPFDSEVLIYKIKAILKRQQSDAKAVVEDIMKVGRYEFNQLSRTLTFEDGTLIKLSPKEAELLSFLMANVNHVVDRNLTLAILILPEKRWYLESRKMSSTILKIFSSWRHADIPSS